MFTVKITKKTIEERPAGKEWEVIAGNRADNTQKYGYTPEIIKKKEVEQKIYEQTVDEIDIINVIEAVNKPSKCMAKMNDAEYVEFAEKRLKDNNGN